MGCMRRVLGAGPGGLVLLTKGEPTSTARPFLLLGASLAKGSWSVATPVRLVRGNWCSGDRRSTVIPPGCGAPGDRRDGMLPVFA